MFLWRYLVSCKIAGSDGICIYFFILIFTCKIETIISSLCDTSERAYVSVLSNLQCVSYSHTNVPWKRVCSTRSKMVDVLMSDIYYS